MSGADVLDYPAIRRSWMDDLDWREHEGVRVGIVREWPLGWEWADCGRSMEPLRPAEVHLVRAVLGLTGDRRPGPRAYYLDDLSEAAREPWVVRVGDPRPSPDTIGSVAVYCGLDGMGSARIGWSIVEFDDLWVLAQVEDPERSQLPRPMALVPRGDAVRGAAIAARDHAFGSAVEGPYEFEFFDLIEPEGMPLHAAYRFFLGICGCSDAVILAEDPEEAARSGKLRLTASFEAFVAKLPGPDGRRKRQAFEEERARGQVGWVCSAKYLGRFVLCLRCGAENRPSSSIGHSKPLHIDQVRPQSQSCWRCHTTLVKGVLGHGPDRYPRPERDR